MALTFVSDGVGYIALRARDSSVVAWAMVDPDALADVAQFAWHLTDTGYAHRWYGGRPPRRKGERMHRRILGLVEGDGLQGDHMNHNRLDNRRANLRIVTDGQNKQNFPSCAGSTSIYRGVSWDKARGKWKAQGKAGGRNRLIGRFATEQEANEAAIAWRRKHMPHSTD